MDTKQILIQAGNHVAEALAKVDSRLVGEPAEHHVAHCAQLCLAGGDKRGVRVAVNSAPPRAHPLDQAAAVDELDFAALRAADLVGGEGIVEGGVGMPEVVAVEGIEHGRGEGSVCHRGEAAG